VSGIILFLAALSGAYVGRQYLKAYGGIDRGERSSLGW